MAQLTEDLRTHIFIALVETITSGSTMLPNAVVALETLFNTPNGTELNGHDLEDTIEFYGIELIGS